MQAPAQTQPIVGQLPYPEGLVEYVDKITGGKNRAKYIIDLLNWIFRRYGVGGKMIDYTLTGIENMSLAENSVTEYIRRQVDVIATVGETQMYLLNTGRSLITVDGEPSLSDDVPLQIVDDADNSKLLFTIPAGMLDGTFNEETWTAYVGSPLNVCSVFTEAQFRRQGLPLLSQMRFEYNKLKEIENDLAESQGYVMSQEPTFNGVPLSQMNDCRR
ncbi:hypothetical protein SPFM10_00264 [Salmonella phage SPFM10]|nr:hypothetical protein SPFM10_00264 [Salmonella phage SPFM10]